MSEALKWYQWAGVIWRLFEEREKSFFFSIILLGPVSGKLNVSSGITERQNSAITGRQTWRYLVVFPKKKKKKSNMFRLEEYNIFGNLTNSLKNRIICE